MQIGMIGLGRMGGNLLRRLMRHGHEAVVYDRDAKATTTLANEGATAAGGLKELVQRLGRPRAVWVMLPAGMITEAVIAELAQNLEAGDVILDGGNTFWKDDIRRAKMLKEHNIAYVDVGTSGGVWGLERGYCMMIGGDKEIVDRLDPIFGALAPGLGNVPRTSGRDVRDARPEHGYVHVGRAGPDHSGKWGTTGMKYDSIQALPEASNFLKNPASKAFLKTDRLSL